MVNLGHENEKKSYILSPGEIQNGCVSIVAILNKTTSGELCIGVKNNGDIFGIETVTQHTLDKIYETIHNNIDPHIYPEIFYDSKLNIIKINFTGQNRPYSFKKNYYLRSYDENREMDYDSLMNEIRFIDQNTFYEESLSSESVRTIDETLIKDINTRVGVKSNRRDIRDSLNRYKIIKGNNLTLAGRNLFSKKTPIDIQINVYQDTYKKKIIKTNLIKGNIFEIISKVCDFVEAEQSKDKSSKKIINDLIKETLIFSFLNTSFNRKEPYMILITPLDITIKFPGTLFYLNSLEEYFDNDYYIQNKNKTIAKIFDLANMPSNSKKCLDKIGEICKKHNVIFSSSTTPTALTITYFKYDEKYKNVSIEQAILSILSSRPTIKADILANKLNRTRRTIQTAIKKLKESNLIVRKGSNKNGYWIVNK